MGIINGMEGLTYLLLDLWDKEMIRILPIHDDDRDMVSHRVNLVFVVSTEHKVVAAQAPPMFKGTELTKLRFKYKEKLIADYGSAKFAFYHLGVNNAKGGVTWFPVNDYPRNSNNWKEEDKFTCI